MSSLNHVLVEIGREHSDVGGLDLGRFRGLVEELIHRAYPGAHVMALFNDLRERSHVEVGISRDDRHVHILHQLIDLAAKKLRSAASSAPSRG